MTKSRDTLKTYFETGDIPTEPQFKDLIDSLRHPEDGKIIKSHSKDSAGNTTITLSEGAPIVIQQGNNNGAKQEVIPSKTLNKGWYTVAVNKGDRASAKFILRDRRSSYHQMVHFYAAHHFGNGNVITVLSNSSYNNKGSFRHLRIKRGSTYDGAMLQVYVDADSTPVSGWILENYQSTGWVPKNWIPEGTDPGGLNNFAAMIPVGLTLIDLDKTQGIHSSETIVSDKEIIARGNITAGRDVIAFSDARLKTNITPSKESFLNKIDRLTPSYYKWKDESKDQTQQLGFIAQEVKEVFPEWVHKSDEHYAMSYDKMGAVIAVKGVQELHAEVKTLKEEIKELKSIIKELKHGITH